MLNDPNELITRLYPIDATGSGGIPADGSVTLAKLASEVTTSINGKADDFDSISGGNASLTSTSPESTNVSRINWLALGDSLTDLYNRPQNYPYWLAYRNPGITMTNIGIGGALWCWDRDNSVNSRQVVNIYHQSQKSAATSSNPDIITILAGVNDYIWGVPLGTMEDIYDLSTYAPNAVIDTSEGHGGLPASSGSFYQAVSYTLKGILDTYPRVPVVVFTPMTGNDAGGTKLDKSYGHTIGDFQDAIKAVCGYWGVPCCDLGRHSIITQRDADDKTAYFFDDTHPNGAGSLILSRIIEHEVRKTLHFVGKDF